jgi:hypothetical protein
VQIVAGAFHTLCLDNNGKAFAFGDNEDGQLGIGNTQRQDQPILISFFEELRIAHIRCLAERWDIKILTELAKGKTAYAKTCSLIFLEKLAKEKSPQQRASSLELISNQSWYHDPAQELLKTLTQLGEDTKNPKNDLTNLKRKAIEATTELVDQISLIEQCLLLVDVAKAYGNEENSPYGFISQEQGTSYGNTDCWATIMDCIKAKLKTLRDNAEKSGVKLTKQQYTDACTILNTHEKRNFTFDLFPADNAVNTPYELSSFKEEPANVQTIEDVPEEKQNLKPQAVFF